MNIQGHACGSVHWGNVPSKPPSVTMSEKDVMQGDSLLPSSNILSSVVVERNFTETVIFFFLREVTGI